MPRASWLDYFLGIAEAVATRATRDRGHEGAIMGMNIVKKVDSRGRLNLGPRFAGRKVTICVVDDSVVTVNLVPISEQASKFNDPTTLLDDLQNKW